MIEHQRGPAVRSGHVKPYIVESEPPNIPRVKGVCGQDAELKILISRRRHNLAVGAFFTSAATRKRDVNIAEADVFYELAIHSGEINAGPHFPWKWTFPGILFKVRSRRDGCPNAIKDDVANDSSGKIRLRRVGGPVPPRLN